MAECICDDVLRKRLGTRDTFPELGSGRGGGEENLLFAFFFPVAEAVLALFWVKELDAKDVLSEEEEFVCKEEAEVGMFSADPAAPTRRFWSFLRCWWLSRSSLHRVPLETLAIAEKSEEVMSS